MIKKIISELKIVKCNLEFEIHYFWKNKILVNWLEFRVGVRNIIKWFKLVYYDRWWDYQFLLDTIRFKLVDMERHWGKYTSHEDDYKKRDILRELIQDLDQATSLKNSSSGSKEDEELAQKAMSKFFRKLDRNIFSLWDS